MLSFFVVLFVGGGGGGGGGGIGFYGPFKNISLIKQIVHRRWAKTGEKPPDHP